MIRKLFDKIGAQWVFLIIVVATYAVTLVVHPSACVEAFSGFLKLLVRMLPVLALVFGIIFLTNLLIDPKSISKHLGEGSSIRGWLIAIAGGIISTGPIYMWYPLLSDLKAKGMKTAYIATFLYNRAVKIPLLPMMVFYFGVRYTAVLTAYMVIFSVLNGLAVARLTTATKGDQ
jgi:uncharacterized membrane protein YraQ (UPF0718 family)